MRQRGFALIFVILIVLVVGVAAFFVGASRENIHSIQNQLAVKQSTPSTAPTTNPMSNWKTYTNTKYLYEIKIPANWTVGTKGGADESTFSSPVIGNNCKYDSGELCQQFYFEASTDDGKLEPSFIISSNDKVINKKESTINGYKAVEFEYFQALYFPSGRWQYVIIVGNGKFKYQLNYEENQKGDTISPTNPTWKEKTLFDQIVSTLKFTK